MPATAEKSGILDGNLEQRDLQTAQQRLDTYRQVAIIENEIKQETYQIDNIGIMLRDPFRPVRRSTTRKH
jgi:hypothetical protein